MAERSEAEIRERIEQTRARLGDTIEQIGDRVNPDRVQRELKSRAREQIHEMTDGVKQKARDTMHDVEDGMKDAGRGVWATIRENPLPAGMVGVGLAWLLANRKSGDRHEFDGRSHLYTGGYVAAGPSVPRRGFNPAYSGTMPGGGYTAAGAYMGAGDATPARTYGNEPRGEGIGERASNAKDAVRDKAEDAVDTVRDAAGSVRDKASDVIEGASDRLHDVQDRVEHWAESAQYRARRVEHRVEDAVHENPFAAGAVALAIGFAAGLMVPETQKEHQLLGPTRERLVDRAEDEVRRASEKIRKSAKETAGNAAREAVDHAWPISGDSDNGQGFSEPRR